VDVIRNPYIKHNIYGTLVYAMPCRILSPACHMLVVCADIYHSGLARFFFLSLHTYFVYDVGDLD
jgi:hypothetical protein